MSDIETRLMDAIEVVKMKYDAENIERIELSTRHLVLEYKDNENGYAERMCYSWNEDRNVFDYDRSVFI